jgi:hypothetical protein
MEVDRRALIKGILASGALLALGVPSWAFADQPARRPKVCILILTGTGADEAFAVGTQAACVAMAHEGFRTVRLKGGLLTDMDKMVNLLDQSRGLRMIAILDDASAVVFSELARLAGVRMLSMGTHACSIDGECRIRHDFASTSQVHSVGGLLASQLILRQASFSIVESYLHDASEGLSSAPWSAPGFCSYRSADPQAFHLHCSGFSLPDACRLLGLGTTETWTPIPVQVSAHDSTTTWLSKNWVESVGYAITASALGMDSVNESCSGRAFMRQCTETDRVSPQERFMSFVMDL